MSRLLGKKAVVTGAGSGFGAEIARRFAAEGARVACADLDNAAATRIAGEIGADTLAVECDVTSAESVANMVEMLKAEWGGFDTLVNNAGIAQEPKRIDRLPHDTVTRIFAVNVFSLHHVTIHALPVLREAGGGCIINMASVAALRPRAGMAWYTASKAAVISLTQSMAADFAPFRVRVNAIAPSLSRTQMFTAIFGDNATEELQANLAGSIPLGRLSEPADIASAAVFLASDEAAYITGAILPVDGGRLVA